MSNIITLDYQLLTFCQNTKYLIISMFHSVPPRSAEKWNALLAFKADCLSALLLNFRLTV